MQAKEIMTSAVVTAAPDMPAREVARLMCKHGISGLPVVDSSGELVGMVSEGDLIGRIDFDRERRRDWWLTLFSETPLLSADSVLGLARLFAKLRIREKRANEIMSAPVVTIGEATDAQEIADLLTAHRIKRVPVMRDGKVVGIVSRGDLIRVMAAVGLGPCSDRRQSNSLVGWFDKIDRRFSQLQAGSERSAEMPGAVASRSVGAQMPADATEFRTLVADHETQEARAREEERRAVAKLRSDTMKTLIGDHITEKRWREVLHRAREAAAQGATNSCFYVSPTNFVPMEDAPSTRLLKTKTGPKHCAARRRSYIYAGSAIFGRTASG